MDFKMKSKLKWLEFTIKIYSARLFIILVNLSAMIVGIGTADKFEGDSH